MMNVLCSPKKVFFLRSQWTKSGFETTRDLYTWMSVSWPLIKLLLLNRTGTFYFQLILQTLKETIIRNLLVFLLCQCYWGHQSIQGTASSFSIPKEIFFSGLRISRRYISFEHSPHSFPTSLILKMLHFQILSCLPSPPGRSEAVFRYTSAPTQDFRAGLTIC